VKQVRAALVQHALEHGLAGVEAAALAGLGKRRRLRRAPARAA
jgi:hypothetical protein